MPEPVVRAGIYMQLPFCLRASLPEPFNTGNGEVWLNTIVAAVRIGAGVKVDLGQDAWA